MTIKQWLIDRSLYIILIVLLLLLVLLGGLTGWKTNFVDDCLNCT